MELTSSNKIAAPALSNGSSTAAAKGRVLMLSTNLGKGGGAEEQVMLLSLGLRVRGWRVKIVSLLPPSPLAPELENSDIAIGSLGMRPGIPDPRAMLRLIRVLREFRPDLVHCHMPQANLLARAVRPLHSIPVVISTLHNVTMERVNGSSGRFLEIAHGLTDRFSDLTTVICSPGVQGYVERGAVRSGRITVVHNGVNTAQYQPDPATRQRIRRVFEVNGMFVWLAVGRFTPAKAYPDLIRAFSKMLERSSKPTVLLICGQGPLEAEIRSLVRKCGVESHVRFLGLRPNIPQIMNAADGFVLSSHLEGLPMVLLEASATGLPIVATAVGGNPEVVVDGKTGFIVQPRNVESLAAAMERMMNLSASEREIMACAGRKHARERFDMENILGQWEKLYTDLIGRIGRKTELGKEGATGESTGISKPAWPVAHNGIREAAPELAHNAVTRQALALPALPAIYGTETSMTFERLDQESNRLARHLQSLGVGLEVPVGLYLERSPDFVVAALAVLKAGGAYVPLDPSCPPDRIAAILEDSEAPVLLSHKWMAAGLRSGAWSTVDLDIDAPQITRHTAEALVVDISGSNLAYVIYTSGSTGRPKGVEVTHANLANLIAWHRNAFSITPTDRASQVAGLAFDAAVWEMWCHLAAGASLHLIDETSRRSPEGLRDWLVEHHITVAFAPTVMAEHLITLDWPSETALRILLTGADTLHRYPRIGLPFTLVNNYGPTECTVLVTSGTVAPCQVDPCQRNIPQNSLPSIGHPIEGTVIQILDSILRPVPAGESGEICVSGPQVARGYRNLPELTSAKFVSQKSVPGGRLYRTGDRGRFLPNGDIAFLGRIDSQIKIRGFRVEPDEIVAHLNHYAGIAASVVIARGIGPDCALVAYLVPVPGFVTTSAKLREFLASRLPDYMIPSAFVRLDSLPVTTSGKCDKDALPAPSTANLIGDANTDRSPDAALETGALSATEEKMIQLVSALMDSRPIGRDDNFFFIGGHSMMAAQLMARIGETFGLRLTLRQLFEAPTAGSLARLVDQQRSAP